MLAGTPPFTGPTAQAVLARHAVDPVAPIRTVRETVPRGVEQAVLKALAKVPADRYAGAPEFAQALNQPALEPAPAVVQGRAITWARGASLTGRPYLARAAEEHSGPHMPWFWRGELQGGGVLNDMMCHSALVGRHLLTKPGAPSSSVPPAPVTGHISSLKWTRPH